MTMARNQLWAWPHWDPRLVRVRPNGMPDVPIFRINIDYEKVKSLGLSVKLGQPNLKFGLGRFLCK